ncbi:hypothetical protein MVEG_03780 [Podila verticillata NRRL 6337]|nr:hypothetical protein MVEG_03780 [Podila verticillata NRRL 6337]
MAVYTIRSSSMRTSDGSRPEIVEVRVKDGKFGHEYGDEKNLRKIGSQGDSKISERALYVLGQGLDSIDILANDLQRDFIVALILETMETFLMKNTFVVRVMFDHDFERLKSLDKNFDLFSFRVPWQDSGQSFTIFGIKD